MMEYIGATGVPVSFDNVPIDPNIDFHFLLSFAIDSDPSGNPQNGKFSPYWAPNLTPGAVLSVKARHPNVKAVASLSGWSINSKVLSWYYYILSQLISLSCIITVCMISCVPPKILAYD